MTKICPSCGAEAPDQFRFCGLCAAPLDVAPDLPPAAEPAREQRNARRLVTMVFADLTNYTRAAQKTDPEEIFLTIRSTLERLAQPVKRLGGRIDRYVGDGFLATFGIPEAHENDPARALLAALEMQQSMGPLRAEAQQSLGWDVQLRIGVNIGPVVSGQLDTGALPDLSVFGHAVNLAQRLQQAARPGTILVSEAICRLTQSQFVFNEPVSLHLKGIDTDVVGYEVTGQRLDPGPQRGLSGRSTPLVGRSSEREKLVAGLQRLKLERQGLLALVTGEPGIGKTRLVEEVLAPLPEHFTIVRVEGSPNEAAYGLLTRIVESLAGVAPDDSSTVRQQRVDAMLSLAGDLKHVVGPVLHGLVGGAAAPDQLIGDPRQEQRRIYAAIRRLMAWMARRRALLLVLDDLQWSDPSSLEVLAHIIDLVYETPTAIIALARSSAWESLPAIFLKPDPAHSESFLDIRLQPLTPAEGDHLLTLLLTEGEVPETFKRSIVEHTSGNPLLIEEMIRMLLDQKVILKTPQGWQIDPHWAETVQKVPDTVNGLILSRYDRLPPVQRKILDSAAALGRSFSSSLLAGMTETREFELRQQLSELEQADFIRRSPGTGLPVYFFRHWLMQEAIYQTLLQSERRTLHLRAAQAIQQMAEDLAIDSASLVGHHLEQAASRKAVPYLLQAAAQAAQRYANQEAMAYYRRAQALLDESYLYPDQAVDAALGLGEMLARTGQPQQAREELERARKLSLGPSLHGFRLGDIVYQLGRIHADQGASYEALACLDAAAATLQEGADQPKSFSHSDVEREMGWVMLSQGNLAEARTHAQKALALALQESQPEAAGSAYNVLAGIDYWAGQLSASVQSALEALAIRERIGDVWGSAATQSNLGALYHKLGQWTQAESFLRQAIFVQQEIGDRHGLGASWNMLGLLLQDAGRYQESLYCINQAIAALQEQAQLPAVAQRYLSRGQVWLRLGVAAWARSDLEKSLDAAHQVKNDDLRAIALAYLAEAHLIGNELDQAQALHAQAAALAEASGSPETRAEIMRVKSCLLREQHDWEGALEANRQAQELFQQIGNQYEVARRQVEAAEIRLARPTQTSELLHDLQGQLHQALETFRQLHAQVDILRVEDLLAKISTVAQPAEAGIRPSAPQVLVAVHVRFEPPDLPDQRDEEQEEVAALLKRLVAALEKVGRERSAVVTASGSGLTFLLSSLQPEMSDTLALRAVQCALEAIDAGVRLNQASRRQYGFEIPLSVGISAGHGLDPREDPQQAALSASVSQIGRQAEAGATLAAPNQVILTDQIVEFVQSVHEVEVVDTSSERRLSGPAYRLGRVRSGTRLLHAVPGPSPRLIGRQAELKTLTDWVDRLRTEERGRVCYLEAEAGMGKTRLLEQMIAHAQPDVLCLIGKCESFRSAISYWALMDILDHADLPETPASQQLKSLLGLRPPDDADDHLLRNLPPAELRQEIFGRVRQFLLQQARQRHLLIVVEDIHWLDLSSLDLIDFLLPLSLQAPISILLVARAEMPGPHRALVSKAERMCQDRYLPVRFSGLTEAESRELVGELLNTPALPDNLWDQMAPFVGHPLSMEEALRFLVERDWLWKAAGGWQLLDLKHSLDRRMPTTFQDLLLRRLDVLSSETLHVLQAAAVLGETFDRTVLGHIVPDPGISHRLTELVERGWLLAAGADNPLLYRFKHTLTRETIYATLLTSKRQVLHQRAGEALEALYPENQEQNLELLAHHFGHSRLRERALHYLVRGAEKSAARHALAESLSYFRQAQARLEPGASAQPRLAATIALGLADVHLALGEPAQAVADLTPLQEGASYKPSREVEVGCLRRLGAARRKMGEFPAALQCYQIARARLENAPDPAEREALLISLGIAQTLFEMRENQSAHAQAERVLRLTDQRRHPELAAETLNLLGGMAYRQGNAEAAAELVQQSLAIYLSYGNRSGAASAYANLGVLAAHRGDLDSADSYFALSLGLREALGDIQGLAITRNNLGQLEKSRGRFAEAIRHFTLAIEHARHSELAQLLAQCLSNLGQALTLIGRRAEALAALDEAAALCQSYGYKSVLCEIMWKRADCLTEDDSLAAAESAAQAAVNLATELHSHDLMSEAQRALGRTYRKVGKHAAALEAAGSAWHARSEDPDPAIRARFAAEYGLALHSAGRADEARSLLTEHASLVESSATQQEVLEALAAQPAPPASG